MCSKEAVPFGIFLSTSRRALDQFRCSATSRPCSSAIESKETPERERKSTSKYKEKHSTSSFIELRSVLWDCFPPLLYVMI